MVGKKTHLSVYCVFNIKKFKQPAQRSIFLDPCSHLPWWTGCVSEWRLGLWDPNNNVRHNPMTWKRVNATTHTVPVCSLVYLQSSLGIEVSLELQHGSLLLACLYGSRPETSDHFNRFLSWDLPRLHQVAGQHGSCATQAVFTVHSNRLTPPKKKAKTKCYTGLAWLTEMNQEHKNLIIINQ